MIRAHGSFDESGDGAIIWLLIFYFWFVGIPIYIASIIFGIISICIEKRFFSYVFLVLDFLPFLLLYLSAFF